MWDGGGREGKQKNVFCVPYVSTPFFLFLLEHRQTGLLKTRVMYGCTCIIPLHTLSALYDTLGLKLTRWLRCTHLMPRLLSIHGYDTVCF